MKPSRCCWALLAVLSVLLLSGCGHSKLEIDGAGTWAVFQDKGRADGTGPTTLEVDRGQRITVQLLAGAPIRARVRSKSTETPWRPMLEPLDAVEFYVK